MAIGGKRQGLILFAWSTDFLWKFLPEIKDPHPHCQGQSFSPEKWLTHKSIGSAICSYVGWPLWGGLVCVCVCVWLSKWGTEDKLCKHPAEINTRACSWYKNVSTCSVCSLFVNYSVYTNLILMASVAIAVHLPVTSCELTLEARSNFHWLRRLLYTLQIVLQSGGNENIFMHFLRQSKGIMYISRCNFSDNSSPKKWN
jgi:hypothetical protein